MTSIALLDSVGVPTQRSSSRYGVWDRAWSLTNGKAYPRLWSRSGLATVSRSLLSLAQPWAMALDGWVFLFCAQKNKVMGVVGVVAAIFLVYVEFWAIDSIAIAPTSCSLGLGVLMAAIASLPRNMWYERKPTDWTCLGSGKRSVSRAGTCFGSWALSEAWSATFPRSQSVTREG